MTSNNRSFYTVGGVAFIAAGILFFARALLALSVPNPPSDEAELMKWLAAWKFSIGMCNEMLFFAAICLAPSVFVLYRILSPTDKTKTMIGCGIIAITIPVLAMTDIVQGRLAYPVYDIALSPDSLRLALSIYYGGMHAMSLLSGVAILVLSFAVRRSVLGKPAAYFGFTAGVFSFIGAYPWLVGPVLDFVSQLLFAGWLAIIGIRIVGKLQGLNE